MLPYGLETRVPHDISARANHVGYDWRDFYACTSSAHSFCSLVPHATAKHPIRQPYGACLNRRRRWRSKGHSAHHECRTLD
jgi:hypothetical protein